MPTEPIANDTRMQRPPDISDTDLSNAPAHNIQEAFETYGWVGRGPLVVSCEHASARVPPPLVSSESDDGWLKTHWGIDIGARTLAMEITRLTGSSSILARFSRLVCDANREVGAPDQILQTVEDGNRISFNDKITSHERQRRIDAYYTPYHAALNELLTARLHNPVPALFVSIHSFTPVWNHAVRDMDFGVLFRSHATEAEQLEANLKKRGFFTALNRPYSAFDHMMFTAMHHGEHHDVVHLELECNQALLCTEERARAIAPQVAAALIELPMFTDQ